ncbi:MAG: hypothetical protein LBL65_05640 [Campylobacteraceae bacterium]|jgi:hypothetical protein|nr:hypothetical protein [Campylobacteraceae bacterium]
MGTRKLTIRIYQEGDWFIDIGIEKKKNHLHTALETPFATCYRDENGRIKYLFDVIITEAQMKVAEKMKEFLEVCEFSCNKETFTGDFIDALIFIAHKLKAENGKDKKAS